MKKIASKIRLPQFIRTKWFAFGVVGVVLLASVGGYIWWSKASWDSYEKHYSSVKGDLSSKLEAVFSLQSDTHQEKQEKLARLKALEENFANLDGSLCAPNALIAWQKLIKGYANRESSCKSVQASVNTFRDSLKQAVNYLENEATLAKLIAVAPGQAEVGEVDFDGQLTTWRSVHESIKSTSASGKFENVKGAAVTASEDLVRAWEEVAAGHKAKDKVKYVKATQDLALAYDKLETITTINTEQLTLVANEVKQAYTQLK